MTRTITVSPQWSSWHDFLLALPDRMDSEGVYVYGGERNLIKNFTAPDGTIIVVKRYHKPRFINKIVYSWGIRRPKGERAFRYASLLNEHHVETPMPVAYIEDRHCTMLCESYLITLRCPYPHLMYEMGEATPDVYRPMAKALAAFTASMHDAQILHRDYSPGNILWQQDHDGGYHFSIVDINRMHFGPVSIKRGCSNFARLWGPKEFIILTVKVYARLRGFDIDEAVGIALKARRRFWTRFRKKHRVKFPLEL